ncbi:MAG: hypothetical protein NTV11_00815 [Rhodocyclales bacterium]|nr:hypothetical protein [Rhodocyclales bacterium]
MSPTNPKHLAQGSFDDWGPQRVLKVASLKDLLARPFPMLDYLIEGFIPKATNVYVRVNSGVAPHASQMFAVIVGVSVAAGARLEPLGFATASNTFLVTRTGNLSHVREQVQLAYEKLNNPLVRNRAKANFCLHHHQIGGEPVGHLNDKFDQDTLLQSMPPNCELVIFLDSARLMAGKKDQDVLSYRHFHRFLADLNKDGIATLIFYEAHRKANVELEDELLSDGANYLLTLTTDPAAPHDYGGGFIVERRKISEFDTVPTRFSFWYTVVDGKLDYGWEIRDPANDTTAKNVEMIERQKRVRDLSAKGMQQKAIAVALGVDAATVSRDLAKIKAADRPKAADPDEFNDDGMAK